MKVDYQKTFIYKLCCRDPTITDIYVGNSTNFKQRNREHKSDCNNINNEKKYNQHKNRFIRENGGYDNWIMIKLYDFPCNSKREAEAEETKTMIELNATLNSYKPFTTEEEKKDQKKRIHKEYYEKNKTEFKKYYNDNKTEISEKKKVNVKCEFCNCEVRKYSLHRHQKSLKCKKFQEFVDVE